MAGNAEVALGELSAAQQHFQRAAEDPGLESIAYANLALVSFESGDDEAAIRAARQLLRRSRTTILVTSKAAFNDNFARTGTGSLPGRPAMPCCHAQYGWDV